MVLIFRMKQPAPQPQLQEANRQVDRKNVADRAELTAASQNIKDQHINMSMCFVANDNCAWPHGIFAYYAIFLLKLPS